MPFEINDIVRIRLKPAQAPFRVGMTGVVKKILDEDIGVQFYEYIKGHNLEGAGVDGYCFYLTGEFIEKITPEKVKIGDRIVVINPGDAHYLGCCGIVRIYSKENVCFGIELDEEQVTGRKFLGVAGHSCDGAIPSKRGIWLSEGEFIKEMNPNCIIYPVMADYITIVF